jgi:hypothetical protein
MRNRLTRAFAAVGQPADVAVIVDAGGPRPRTGGNRGRDLDELGFSLLGHGTTGQRDQLWAGPEQGPPPPALQCIHGKENCGGGYFEGRMQRIEWLRVGRLAR